MDMESIQIFLDVWKTGSITAASEAHYMTQPALGKRIAALEREMEVTLFNRGKGQARAELTAEGKAFCDIAERMVILYNQAMDLKSDVSKEFLTIASIRSAHDSLLPKLILKLKEHYPKLFITVEDHHTAEIINLLEKRRVDVGIIQTEAPSHNLISRLLYKESYQVVVRQDSPFANMDKIHPKELKAEHSIFQVFDSAYEAWFSQHWSPYLVKVRVNTTPTAEQYFSTKEDWMIVPDAVADSMKEAGYSTIKLIGDIPEHCVYMCWNLDNRRKSLRLLKDIISEYGHTEL